MSESIILALIATAGGVLTAVVAALSARQRQQDRRIRKLEHRDRLSWLYIRKLIDHSYRHARAVPLPEPPAGWLEEETE
jgi:protein involved in polysaccharide export with SLBB domain